MSFRSQKLLDSAEGQPCGNCGRDDGTTVPAHINSVALGKGTGIKAPDCFAADLCHRCHDEYDGRRGRLTPEEKEALWNRAYFRTVLRWFEDGIVKVK